MVISKIDDFLHKYLYPTCQSLKSYIDLMDNPDLRFNNKELSKKLKHCLNRLVELRQELLEIVDKKEEV